MVLRRLNNESTICNNKFSKNKEIKRNLKGKKSKSQKIFKIIMITTLALIVIYLIGAILLAGIALFMIFITLGGAAYVDTQADPSFYNFVMAGIGIYFTGFKFFKYIMYVLYIYVYIFLANGIYIDNLSYKKLRGEKKS